MIEILIMIMLIVINKNDVVDDDYYYSQEDVDQGNVVIGNTEKNDSTASFTYENNFYVSMRFKKIHILKNYK